MLKKLTLTSLFIFILCFVHAQLRWPEVTAQTRPWTRWWWEGSAVNRNDLSWNLEQYQAAGLGGVEITPIYGIHGYETQFIDFLTLEWMNQLKHTLRESKRLGLGVDLANATGWPFGGPWVSDEDASKSVYFKTYSVQGGKNLQEPVVYVREAFVRTANNKPAVIDSIQRNIGQNKNLQALALDQVVFPGPLPLISLMAYSDKGVAMDLTKQVTPKGQLNWTAPSGSWTLYAVFEGLHGKMVERAAPGGEGYAIDHFSATAANRYFKKFDEAFNGHDLGYLRAFFNDSYEVDDARGQANWTTGFFDEFKKRRGYDLRQYLPALFGQDQPERNSRVIYDYRATIDELILEHFTEIWSRWGKSKGKLVRNQSHGSPANTLDLYSAVDIPETEGNDVLRFKFASSASNVTGKLLTSSESATWLNEHFLSSWGDVKKSLDLFFLGGVNHIFYHGTAYSPKQQSWPGWLFYAAVHFQPTNPQWKDFKTLNDYVTRVQSFLQKGRPDNDILLYYPIIDRYADPGRVMLQHFDGMERNFEKTEFEHASKWMLEHGYSFDFFSDRQLQKIGNFGLQLKAGGNSYKAILLPANRLISEKSFQKLVSLARAGATILVYKDLPEDVPGLGKLEERQKIFQQLLSQLTWKEEGQVKKAGIGKGSFIISEDLDMLMKAARARKEASVESGLSSIRRKNPDGYTYFISNTTGNPINQWIDLSVPSASVGLFNPMTGQLGLGRVRREKKAATSTSVLIQLAPHESMIIQTFHTTKQGNTYPYFKDAGTPLMLDGKWNLVFTSGGPVIPAAVENTALGSWTELEGSQVKDFSGTARYSISFSAPAISNAGWMLDLGKVHETAEVMLNGKKLGTLVGPSFRMHVPASSIRPGSNTLEVIISNLMANRIAYMERNNEPWKIFYNINMPARKPENAKSGLFNASHWKPLPSGLLGPVTLTPLSNEN